MIYALIPKRKSSLVNIIQWNWDMNNIHQSASSEHVRDPPA